MQAKRGASRKKGGCWLVVEEGAGMGGTMDLKVQTAPCGIFLAHFLLTYTPNVYLFLLLFSLCGDIYLFFNADLGTECTYLGAFLGSVNVDR